MLHACVVCCELTGGMSLWLVLCQVATHATQQQLVVAVVAVVAALVAVATVAQLRLALVVAFPSPSASRHDTPHPVKT